MKNIVEIDYLKLSIQRALCSNVFPNLRAVSANVLGNLIEVFFYCQGEISEEEREYCEVVITEIIADVPFPDPNDPLQPEFNTPIIRLDFPNIIPLNGFWVYYRYEKPLSNLWQNDSVQNCFSSVWPIPHYYVQLSAQKALLGRVSSMLRSVCVNIDEETVSVVFYYNGEISDYDYDNYNFVIKEIRSDFDLDNKNIQFDAQILRLDCPSKMPLIGRWVYFRAE